MFIIPSLKCSYSIDLFWIQWTANSVLSGVGNFYRPQTKFAKVMFLQVSVCPQGGVCGCSGGVCGCSRGGAWLLPGGCAWLLWGCVCGCSRGACVVALGGGMCGCSGGACVVALGGMHGCSRGHAWLLPGGMRGFSGVCMVAPGGACMGYHEIWRYGQWAGGTHPTGMHSCWIFLCRA